MKARAVLSVIAAALLAGCAHEPAASPPPAAPARPTVATTRTTSEILPSAPSAGVDVSDEILRACNIQVSNVGTAPKFDFDRSEVGGAGRGVLEKVAACVTTGPLKGRSLLLVGRADPRGEAEYNFILGESRAGSVRSYLMELGVDPTRITTTSRGKLDATGTDEASWQQDRRVDVELR